jgi:signal transduction histidine kinase
MKSDPSEPNCPPSDEPRGSYLARALRTVALCIAFGIVLALLRQQNLWYTIVYALCIGLICWFCIDFGRTLTARWLLRWAADRSDGQESDWPGWSWMFVIVFVGSVIGYSAGTALADRLIGGRSSNLFNTGSLRESLSLLLFALLPAMAMTYFFYSRGAIARRNAVAQAAERQAAENRLKLLEAQLEPHMLFNTLANLRVLITLDTPRALAMLDQLIAFLRATLGASRLARHSLRAEFDRLGDFLALIQVRMGDRLAVVFDLPAALADVDVPALLLQPLVENSVKHGLEPAVSGGRIEVRAAREGDELVLSVRDTGVGLRSEISGESGSHFGLSQVRDRLATLYGARASLTLAPADDASGGALAQVRLPLPGERSAS